MAFIRRVRTPSGATGVQIAEYVGDRRQRVVAYVGSAHTPAELGVVMARARQLLAEYERPGQESLDLGLDLEPEVELIGPADEDAELDLALPFAAASRLLFEVLSDVYDQLGPPVPARPAPCWGR